MLHREVIRYLKKKKKKPKSKTLLELAREVVGINLPSPQELIGKLKEKGNSYKTISEKTYGNENHVNSFYNAYVHGHSLRFETYQKLLDYCFREGILKERISLERVLEESLKRLR